MNSDHGSDLSFCLYSIHNYAIANNDFIKNNKIMLSGLDKVCEELSSNKNYHYRIHKKSQYIFFGDIDNYQHNMKKFINILINFMNNTYKLELSIEDVKYTKNNKKNGSYHYSIPKWNLSCENLKELHNKLIKENKEEFTSKIDNKMTSSIDTTIYSEHWYRCPNQSKGSDDNGIHVIKKGNIEDFVIDYIPEDSIDINNIIESIHVKKLLKDKKIVDKINILNNMAINKKTSNNLNILECNQSNEEQIITCNKDILLSSTLSQPQLYKKMFDECYKQEQFETYDNWISIGFAIRNIFGDNDAGIELFNYYSAKGRNYEGYEITKNKYQTFIRKSKGYTVATIYYYAIEDNKPKFIEIISKNSLELGQTDISKYIKILAGNRFIYKKSNDVYKLYCLNKNGIWINDDILLKKFISNELYNFLKLILVEVYWDSKEFSQLKAKLERIKYMTMKRDIIETYKEDGLCENVDFDNKWWLFGFNNMIYDIKKQTFRKYHYDDYVVTTTGYDWREPTEDEINTVEQLINKIFPIEDEKELYLQILSTGLDGRCLEKFIIANAGGGNGKGVINDLCLCALGNYGLLGNNSILFETNRTGSNPEKANMHKKRMIIFREPPSKHKFQNAIIKELTGGGTFSARTHHEKNTEKELNLTMIVECNQRPLLYEEPQEAELRRIIDINFRSTFTTDISLVDPKKNIYEANVLYKTKEWQEQHKYALIKILIEKHKNYINNNCELKIPDAIAERTNNYLQLSCNIISWFKDNYELTDKNEDIIKVKDIYMKFARSHNFEHMTKSEKKKYNKTYFLNYIETDKFFSKYYCAKTSTMRTFIKGWKYKFMDDSDNEFLDS